MNPTSIFQEFVSHRPRGSFYDQPHHDSTPSFAEILEREDGLLLTQ